MENKVRNFQRHFEIELLSSPKWMKNCIPLHLFLDIWLQKLSYNICLIDCLINIYFC